MKYYTGKGMSDFEKIFQIDDCREKSHQRERHTSIELSDREQLERLGVRFTFNAAELDREVKLVYKPPVTDEESMSPALKKKLETARNITKDTQVIDLRKKDAKIKSKSTSRKPKKDNSSCNIPAMESVQEKL